MAPPLLGDFWLINIKLPGKQKKENINQTCMDQWPKCQQWKLDKLQPQKFSSESRMFYHFLTQLNSFLVDGTLIQKILAKQCKEPRFLIWIFNKNWLLTCSDTLQCVQFIIPILSPQIKLKEQTMLLREQTRNNIYKLFEKISEISRKIMNLTMLSFYGQQTHKDSQSFNNNFMVASNPLCKQLKGVKIKFHLQLFSLLLQCKRDVLSLMDHHKIHSCQECQSWKQEFISETILKLDKQSLRQLLWIFWQELE